MPGAAVKTIFSREMCFIPVSPTTLLLCRVYPYLFIDCTSDLYCQNHRCCTACILLRSSKNPSGRAAGGLMLLCWRHATQHDLRHSRCACVGVLVWLLATGCVC